MCLKTKPNQYNFTFIKKQVLNKQRITIQIISNPETWKQIANQNHQRECFGLWKVNE